MDSGYYKQTCDAAVVLQGHREGQLNTWCHPKWGASSTLDIDLFQTNNNDNKLQRDWRVSTWYIWLYVISENFNRSHTCSCFLILVDWIGRDRKGECPGFENAERPDVELLCTLNQLHSSTFLGPDSSAGYWGPDIGLSSSCLLSPRSEGEEVLATVQWSLFLLGLLTILF